MKSTADIPSPEQCVIGPLLYRWARERPESDAFVFDEGPTWTWFETLRKTRSVASRLRGLGVQTGDHVLSWQPNGPEAVLTWFALNYIGAVYVPMNTAYKGMLLENLIQLSDAELMICNAAYIDRLHHIDSGRKLSDIVVVGDASHPLTGYQFHPGTSLFVDDCGDDSNDEDMRDVQPWDSMYIIFTSGTTGPSKAVLSSYVQTYTTGAEAFDFVTAADRILVNLPLFHVSGTVLVAMAVTAGCSCVLVDGFHTDRFWSVVRKHEITMACLLSAMVPFLLKLPENESDTDHPLKHVVTVPWNQDAAALAKRHRILMRTSYNMTEACTPLVSDVNPDTTGTCGKPRRGMEVRVVNEHDEIVPTGTVGELIIRTDRPWAMNSGYYKDPEATARAWRNGWFHTGDAFRRDEQGNFFFVDRLTDAIRRRGENISSFEVESEVTAYPDVADAAAIPVPSDLSEDEVMIVVSPVTGKKVDPEHLFYFLEERMAHFMLPSYIRVLEELPKTPTQKVRKELLRRDGITEDTWFRGDHGINVRREK